MLAGPIRLSERIAEMRARMAALWLAEVKLDLRLGPTRAAELVLGDKDSRKPVPGHLHQTVAYGVFLHLGKS